jgi:hypothetical protein
MITYNQERYIAQAVTSALEQVTDFPVEIVIGEDCSTDGTRAILQELQQAHPDRIRLLLRDENLGMFGNFADTLSQCQGEFVALLEGDDYWTSPHKLQRQVDAMRANPHWAICFHTTRCVSEPSNEVFDYPNFPVARESSLQDLLKRNIMQTCSVLYRRSAIPFLPGWMTDLPLVDWPLHVLVAQQGAIGFLPERMATYRIHGAGVWATKSLRFRLTGTMRMLQRLSETLGSEHLHAVHEGQLNVLALALEPVEALESAVWYRTAARVFGPVKKAYRRLRDMRTRR